MNHTPVTNASGATERKPYVQPTLSKRDKLASIAGIPPAPISGVLQS